MPALALHTNGAPNQCALYRTVQADEAVSSAVEEFSLQGYCLDGIIKSVDGSNTANHPLAAAARALEVAARDGAQPGDLVQRVAELRAPMRGLSGDELQQALVVASKEGVVAALLAAARAAAKLLSADSARSAEDAARALALQSLRGLRLLMQAPGCRAALLEARGLELLQQLLRTGVCSVAATPADEAAQLSPCAELAAAAAALAEAACWQDEEAKCRCAVPHSSAWHGRVALVVSPATHCSAAPTHSTAQTASTLC